MQLNGSDPAYGPGEVERALDAARESTYDTRAVSGSVSPMTSTNPFGDLHPADMTPGQRRMARAIGTRMRAAEQKKADLLADRGWVCLPPPGGSHEENFRRLVRAIDGAMCAYAMHYFDEEKMDHLRSLVSERASS